MAPVPLINAITKSLSDCGDSTIYAASFRDICDFLSDNNIMSYLRFAEQSPMLHQTSFALKLLVIVSLQASLAVAEDISFSRDIRPILSQNCVFCHGPMTRRAKLTCDLIKRKSQTGSGRIPSHQSWEPEKSLLLQRILSKDPDEVMPPPRLHRELSAHQIELLTEWIRQGAKWGKHWSYEPISRPLYQPTASQSYRCLSTKAPFD